VLTQGHSSGAVTADPGKFGGVARPVPTGVSGPAGSGSDAEMEEVGEDRGGNFGGELEQGGPPPGQGADAEGAQPFAQSGGRNRAAGQVSGNSQGLAVGAPTPT